MRFPSWSQVTGLAAAATIIAAAVAGFVGGSRVAVDTPVADAQRGEARVSVSEGAPRPSPDDDHAHDAGHTPATLNAGHPSHGSADHLSGAHGESHPVVAAEPAKPGDRGYPGTPSLEQQLAGVASPEDASFGSVCEISHVRRDDPIVFPRRPGKSHPHDFFGNTTTDAFSTADSLREAARSTCHIDGDFAAYWTPVLYDDGVRVRPNVVAAYYFAGGKEERAIEPFPRGLKMIASDTTRSFWGCQRDDGSLRRVDEPPCPSSETLALVVDFPDCWDARHLDVPDHTSHMMYATDGRCPRSHPAAVPRLELIVTYPSADGERVALGSVDDPLARHADFINAWDQRTLARLVTECLNAGVDCGVEPPA